MGLKLNLSSKKYIFRMILNDKQWRKVIFLYITEYKNWLLSTKLHENGSVSQDFLMQS